jgi:hypothetical protein
LIGSGPHLAHAVPPHKTYAMLKDAVDHGASEYAIFNVSNIREFVLGINATAQMTWDMASFNPDSWLSNWVSERFSAEQERIVNAYKIYYSSYQIHDTQGVPFLLDGQTLGKIRSSIKNLQKQMSASDFGKGASPENLIFSARQQAYGGNGGDAFLAGVSDMHPPSLGTRHTIKSCAAQSLGFELAVKHAESILESLPPQEARFLQDNLIYPARLMQLATSCLQNLLLAGEMFDLGDLIAGKAYIGLAAANMQALVESTADYCRGPWEHWYRGCRKLNINGANVNLQKLKAEACETIKDER